MRFSYPQEFFPLEPEEQFVGSGRRGLCVGVPEERLVLILQI